MVAVPKLLAAFWLRPLINLLTRFGFLTGFLATFIVAIYADDNDKSRDAAQLEFFETKIRPLLVERCYECHATSTEQESSLSLDSREGLLRGGDRGPAIRVGDAQHSLLMEVVRGSDRGLRMPPEDAGDMLSEQQLADLAQWIDEGAIDPRVETTGRHPEKNWSELFQQRSRWWSLQPLALDSPPEVQKIEWAGSAIDRYLASAMFAQGLTPAELAEPQTLIRRTTLVLTGLPPTADEITQFTAEYRQAPDAAYERLVDRLLGNVTFGERFARHWLDIVRFTETHGNEWNYDVPYAYRYRDYLVRALNEDIPYDELLLEHIAGDLLPSPRWSADGQSNESIIGTAFYRFGEVNHDSCVQFADIGYDVADNQLDTLTKAFQATTVACARCHDHKMDAVSSRDYYALLGILRSSRSVQHTLNHPSTNQDSLRRLTELKRDIASELANQWQKQVAQLDGSALHAAVSRLGETPVTVDSPLFIWHKLQQSTEAEPDVRAAWLQAIDELAAERRQRQEFNRQFETVADFRSGLPPGWTTSGMAFSQTNEAAIPTQPDFQVACEGDIAVERFLPSALFTGRISNKLNGALRSEIIERKQAKLSFEVIGGGFSLARIVFNNCQLNYNHQHSFHHPEWSWVTIDFPQDTDRLKPYLELLTFWDNPKFPDPLGTLGQDIENQRLPWAEHAKNPRTWWGIRRIVLHDQAATPQADVWHLDRLQSALEAVDRADELPPLTLQDVAAAYARIAQTSVEMFAHGNADDEDLRWLDWLLRAQFLDNRPEQSPRLQELVASYRAIEREDLTLPTMVGGVTDEFAGFSQPLLPRGEHTRPGELVERGFLEVLDRSNATDWPAAGSGRMQLAQSISNPHNPLTARVMVNRMWHWLFGTGLVRTPDDFGHMGERPSHPELLDYLARRLIAEDWSLKRLIREMLLTRAFQSSAAPTESARQLDPTNKWLSHYSARRAEAEVIRDSLLAVSGRLQSHMEGPSVHPYREVADTEKRLYTGSVDGDGRRSLYLKVQLMEAPHFLSTFNLPGGKVTEGKRDTSNVPAQSLAMLNDPFVLAMADIWAREIVIEDCRSLEQRVAHMFVSALGREPDPEERSQFAAAVRQFANLRGLADTEMLDDPAVWSDVAHTLFNLKEFIYIP